MARIPSGIYWSIATLIGALAGAVTGWTLAWRAASTEYCLPPEADPLLPCYPSFEQNSAAVIATGASPFVVLGMVLIIAAALRRTTGEAEPD
jgi:hypothetical protein